MTRVGLISDTHGMLDPRAEKLFATEQVSWIVHAGDIGTRPDVLYELGAIAPVIAVLGNCDYRIPGFDHLEAIARTTVDGVRILAIHDFCDLGPIPDDVDVVVHGHLHRPSVQWHGDTLVVNPGSASQPRQEPPARTVAILEIDEDGSGAVKVIDLDDLGSREPWGFSQAW